jgi:carbon monoxide dehydrogenase subunit G
MPTARRSRTIAAPAEELWQTIRDPHHLPRWWPRVSRVEDVTENAFTEVLSTSSGKYVRADFTLLESDEHARRLRFQQRVENSPFARLLRSAETSVWLTDASTHAGPSTGSPLAVAPGAGDSADDLRFGSDAEGATAPRGDYPSAATSRSASDGRAATEVTIELRQTLNGFFSRFGAFMVRRAAAKTLEEALDGLERIGG